MPRLAGRDTGWHTLAFSGDGQLLAGASGTSRVLEIMDPNDGTTIRNFTNSAHTVAMMWHQVGRTLAVATADGKIEIWDARSGSLRWASPPMVAPAHSLAFHPERQWLVAACGDDQVRFIDTLQQRFVFAFGGRTPRLAFSPAGIRLGPVWREQGAGWLDIRQPEAFTSFRIGGRDFRISDGAFSRDGRLVAAGHLDTVFVCDTKSGRELRVRESWRIAALVFHPLEDTVVLARGTNGVARYRYEYSGRRLRFSPREVTHAEGTWRALAMTPDGRHFAGFEGLSGRAYVFDHTLTNQIASVGPHVAAEFIALSADGRWVATGSRSDLAVRVWDVKTGECVATVPVGLFPRCAFSSDGRWFVATGDRFELREAGTWKPAPALRFRGQDSIPRSAAFSPDNRFLAVVVDRFAVELFDLQTFESVGVLRPPGQIPMLGLAFSPHGSHLTAYGAEGGVAVWNLAAVEQSLAEFGLGWDAATVGSRAGKP